MRFSEPTCVASVHQMLIRLTADAKEYYFESSFQAVNADGTPKLLPSGSPSLLSDIPEVFPKSDKPSGKGVGNFIRLPGKHHTYDHWSRVLGANGRWLSIEESVEAWLSLPAADSSLIPVAEIPQDAEPEDKPAPRKATVNVDATNPRESLADLAERAIEQERWCDLLQSAGWKLDSERGAVTTWTRPGKTGGRISNVELQ